MAVLRRTKKYLRQEALLDKALKFSHSKTDMGESRSWIIYKLETQTFFENSNVDRLTNSLKHRFL